MLKLNLSPIKFDAPHVLMHTPASTIIEVHGPAMTHRIIVAIAASNTYM